jgi:purine-binding chemotaxis protein CheW
MMSPRKSELRDPLAAASLDRGERFVAFDLLGVGCAAPVAMVREILRFSPVTRVPAMPPWLRGVTNVRGQAIAVADLGPRFGAPLVVAGGQACILLVESEWKGEAMDIGLLVEAVTGVLALGPEEIEHPPSFGTRIPARYLRGLGRQRGRFVHLLDLGLLLSPQELLPTV